MAKISFKSAVAKAKGLYKSGRYKRFSDAVAAAYRGAKATGSKKSKPAKKAKRKVGAVRKRSAAPKKKAAARKNPALTPLASAQLSLGQAYSSYVRADTVRDTKKASKRITAVKERIRKILK